MLWLLSAAAFAAVLAAGDPGSADVRAEPPVLVGSSLGMPPAINASCGSGRCWFPAGGFAVDESTLAVQVSLDADGDTCEASGPGGVVYTSYDAGRSWELAWFIGKHVAAPPSWAPGLRSGPPFCGATGSLLPGGGLLCPAVSLKDSKPALAHDGTGTVELPTLLWTTRQGKLTATAQAKKIKMRCPEAARTLPGGWAPGPVRPAGGTASYRIATCAPEGGNATQVIMRSLDGGWEWKTISTVPPWTCLFTAGKYPRGDEIALGVVDQKALLVINRVTTASVGAQHKYVNYTMNWSPDLGKTWVRWGPEHNISRAMAGQWSVMPKVLQLPSGEIMLAGGRPGVMVWVGGREEGTKWRSINVAAHHNQGVAALGPRAGRDWAFAPALEHLGPSTAPVPNDHDQKCCSHPNCTSNGAWCQSTAYTSLMPVGGGSGSGFCVVYDRLANGWGGPPGQWGQTDSEIVMLSRFVRAVRLANPKNIAEVFSMRFQLKSDDDSDASDSETYALLDRNGLPLIPMGVYSAEPVSAGHGSVRVLLCSQACARVCTLANAECCCRLPNSRPG
jgi:hypothetical protein